MRNVKKSGATSRNSRLFVGPKDQALPKILVMLIALVALIALMSAITGGTA